MKLLKNALVVLLLMATGIAYSQTYSVPKNVKLKKDADYAKYEADIIECVEWLESSPADENGKTRAEAALFLIQWIEGAPNVTITLSKDIADFNDKNTDLMVIFMGGWTKYALQNPDDKSEVSGAVAGLKSVAAFYKANIKSLKKDKFVEGVQKRIDEGTLEEWVKKQMGK